MAFRLPQIAVEEPIGFLERADALRIVANGMLDVGKKSELGQFMTPVSVASFMAELFNFQNGQDVSLLDPGAGVGSLTSAFVANVCRVSPSSALNVDAYEIDAVMRLHLEGNLECCRKEMEVVGGRFFSRILPGDFIDEATEDIQSSRSGGGRDVCRYTHCVMNPPYKKIPSSSAHWERLKSVEIDSVNLYTAFMALAIEQLDSGGQLVAIVPRSFCNGSYYRPFREFLMAKTAIKHIHLFGSRSKAFKHDSVLQENIIIKLERGVPQSDVVITTSVDQAFCGVSRRSYPFDQIVMNGDAEKYIHIPTSPGHEVSDFTVSVRYSLDEIGVQVSTGPVVDFRNREHLLSNPEPGTVPLLWACHFSGQRPEWPKIDGKKPNAIALNSDTLKWLYPNGFYAVVRRFSSKEEKRRVVASLLDPVCFDGYQMLGFENHLNVFHKGKKGLPEALALGLTVFLNSTAVDTSFRRFSGHTQVNATDLKLLKYPSRQALIALGERAGPLGCLSQEQTDNILLETNLLKVIS